MKHRSLLALGLFAWSATSVAASGTGLTGEYFSYRNLTYKEMTRVDRQINFNWGTSGPSAATGSDTFSVRWTGALEVPASQTYTFYTYADDGVRLYVDDKLIINNWNDHAAVENKASLALQSGRKYKIRLEYYDNTGQAIIQLRWSSPNLAKQIIPQAYLYPTMTAPAPQPSATPVPPIATPKPATPTPAPSQSGYVRPYAPSAAWNVPVAGLPLNSTNYASMLWNGAADRPGNFNVNKVEAFAVYDARTATGQYQVNIQWNSALDGQKIPWNPNWKIPAGTDKKVIVLDPPTGREWNLFVTSFNGSTVNAMNGSLVPGSYFTSNGANPPSRGAGIAYLAMLVRPEEIEQGVIRHALAQSINNTDGSRYVAPATKIEHPENPAGIPEGTRFYLNVTNAEIETWVATLPTDMQRAGRIIAIALRDYGWFVADTGGNGAFEFEADASAASKWQAVGMGNRSANGKVYPQDMLDGLLKQEKIRTVVPSDRYP